MKKLWRYVEPFSSNTGTFRTDGQTDRFAMSISRVSMLTRDKHDIRIDTDNIRIYPYPQKKITDIRKLLSAVPFPRASGKDDSH